MTLFVLVIICAWLAVVAFAVMLCLAAHRTDEDVAGAEFAPVIDISAHSISSRQHVA